jgi:peptidoglycan-associated lipoprotein
MHRRTFIQACAVTLMAALVACTATSDNGSGQAAADSGAQPRQGSPATPGSEKDLQSNVGDRVFFETASATIAPEGLKILERQATWLNRYPNVTVQIEGHCDERGTREFNLGLGERRAYVVKQVLVAAGIAATRISTISHGKERPAVVGSNEAAWAQNRRAVTVVQ